MKILAVIFLFSSCASAEACNQQMYDKIYSAIIQQALNAPELTKKVIDQKNDTIENLRTLCKGQRSSYEKTGF